MASRESARVFMEEDCDDDDGQDVSRTELFLTRFCRAMEARARSTESKVEAMGSALVGMRRDLAMFQSEARTQYHNQMGAPSSAVHGVSDASKRFKNADPGCLVSFEQFECVPLSNRHALAPCSCGSHPTSSVLLCSLSQWTTLFSCDKVN